MAARESEPFIKPLRIDARMMRQQFNQFATPCARFHNRPLHQLFADAAAAAMAGDTDVFKQAARDALRTQPGQDAQLQAAYDSALAVLGDNELDVRIARDAFERVEIDLRQRIFDAFPRPAQRIVRQHGDDGTDVLAARATDGDIGSGGHETFQ